MIKLRVTKIEAESDSDLSAIYLKTDFEGRFTKTINFFPGNVGAGLPHFNFPPFSTTVGNQTFDFEHMAERYGGSIIFIPLVAILEHIAIAKAFGKYPFPPIDLGGLPCGFVAKGKTINATQEMLALGLCNVAGSFVRSMPVTGSFTRTAVNNASGVKTTLGGLLTGSMVLLALGLLTSTFFYIPKATLAAVVICAMFYLFDFDAIITLWRTNSKTSSFGQLDLESP